MKNEAGEHIKKWSVFFTKIPTEEAKTAVNKALEQVGKEASYILRRWNKDHPTKKKIISLDVIEKSDLDKIINSLKLSRWKKNN